MNGTTVLRRSSAPVHGELGNPEHFFALEEVQHRPWRMLTLPRSPDGAVT
jgi:hypothetical protein